MRHRIQQLETHQSSHYSFPSTVEPPRTDNPVQLWVILISVVSGIVAITAIIGSCLNYSKYYHTIILTSIPGSPNSNSVCQQLSEVFLAQIIASSHFMETLVSSLLVSPGSIHSLYRHFLDTYYVSGPLLGTGVINIRNHCPQDTFQFSPFLFSPNFIFSCRH